MAKPTRGAKGLFTGSIGEGKDSPPTPAPMLPHRAPSGPLGAPVGAAAPLDYADMHVRLLAGLAASEAANGGVLLPADDGSERNPEFLYDESGRQVGQRLGERPAGHGDTVAGYLATVAGPGQLPTTREIEGMFMSGGCAAYALALQERFPHLVLVADVYENLEEDEGSEILDHVFCVDPRTGKAYDIRGEFESAAALTDQAAETEVWYGDPTMGPYEWVEHREHSAPELRMIIEHGDCIARHDDEDFGVARLAVRLLRPRNQWTTL